MALNDTRRNAAEAECARSATLASRCAPEHRHSCDRPAPDYNRFMSETTEVRCPNCQGQPDIIRLWQRSDCSDIGAKDKQPAHAALAHLGGGDLFASRRACPYPPGPRKGRTSSLGDRPPIRRYTSANLPSRLPNGRLHSTQITCTCLCVGAASTRSTTYSWPKGSSATLAGAPRRPCAGSGDGVLITPLAPADPRHDARPVARRRKVHPAPPQRRHGHIEDRQDARHRHWNGAARTDGAAAPFRRRHR